MDYLSWDLTILSRATQYANLSTASAHVGLSQPQLSRIVAKLEEQLGLTLLDRESRRKSSWTPAALRVAEIYAKTAHGFRAEVGALSSGLTPSELRVGTLEGLVPVAMIFCKALLDATQVMVVHLEVLDTSPLEEHFVKNDLDIIFHARDMGARKYRYTQTLGYQSIDPVKSGNLAVYSMFEYASTTHKRQPTDKAFVSNSLRVRQDWLSSFGGSGTIPSPLRAKKTGRKSEVTVMVMAHDGVPLVFWNEIQDILKKLPAPKDV